MNFLIHYLLPFIVVLGVLVFFHELGHFLVAKYFNVKVLKFALGFGPKLLWKTFGETEYSVRAVPLGGYVKMLGEDPEEEEEAEDLTPEEAERAVRFTFSRPITAGPSPGHAELLWWMCDAAETFTPLSPQEEAELAQRAQGLEPIFPQDY